MYNNYIFVFWRISHSVADLDPNPDLLGLLVPDPLVRGMDPDPDPDPSIIKQN